MSAGSKIEWCDDTWNPWRGCRPVSPGCEHCYAEALVERFHGKGAFGKRVRSAAATFDAPLKWNLKPWVCDECGEAFSAEALKPTVDFHTTKRDGVVVRCDGKAFHRRRVFALSMGDWLDGEVPVEWLADMLDVVRRCPDLDFLLLTKRTGDWRDRIERALIKCQGGDPDDKDWFTKHGDTEPEGDLANWLNDWTGGDAPSNVWVGCTVEDQVWADRRIPELLGIPAVRRFVSYEPALGAVDFLPWIATNDSEGAPAPRNPKLIDWIIVGGESGRGARAFNVEWARSVVRECAAAGVACFVKQLGGVPLMLETEWRSSKLTRLLSAANRKQETPGTVALKLINKKGGDMAEWPEDLRVREWPDGSEKLRVESAKLGGAR